MKHEVLVSFLVLMIVKIVEVHVNVIVTCFKTE
jgi:hypothetical protein